MTVFPMEASDLMQHLSEEEALLVETIRQFIDRDVMPSVRDVEHANEYPEQWIEQMKQIGVYGLAIPEEFGGAPVSMPCYVQVTEELARGWMSLAGAMGGHTVVAKLILAFGTDEQRQKFLPAMATGQLRATMALTEPGGGSDLQAMTTIAVADGEDLVVNGSKTWISNARRSGLIALLCKTDPNAEPRQVRASSCPAIFRSSATRASSRARCPSRTTACRHPQSSAEFPVAGSRR
jgi:alkylation response protein AidB-like acyl-CoA dehydrogenase